MSVETQEIPTQRQKLYAGEPQLRQKRRKLFDRWARWLVAGGGFAIIASILAILIFIAIEILPLFWPAEVRELSRYDSQVLSGADERPEDIIAFGLDENREIGYVVTSGGLAQFFHGSDGQPREQYRVEGLGDAAITTAWQTIESDRVLVGTDDGRVAILTADYNLRFRDGNRTYEPEMTTSTFLQIDEQRRPLAEVAFAGDLDESVTIAAITSDGRVVLFLQRREASFLGEATVDSLKMELEPRWTGRPKSFALDGAMGNFYIGTDDGRIYHWQLALEGGAQFVSSVQAARKSASLTQMTFLLGNRTLVVGTSDGRVSIWFLIRDETSPVGWRLTHIRDLEKHPAPVVEVAASARGKGFISADAAGNLYLQYSTSERFLAGFSDSASPVRRVSYAPKANGALTMNEGGEIVHWDIDNPHPEASFKAFFGKVWYEGYDKPEFVWQSTGGTDEFEPKLSLVPLIFGSFKGTIYALILAIPIAILGALFTSQFMHPAFRNKIKPAVEIMAALPSVVLGFLGGLWLAPRVEKIVPALMLMAIVLPTLMILSSMVWHAAPLRFRNRFRVGVESLLLVPVMLAGVWLCLELNGTVEGFLFSGDFKVWLFESLDLSFDQRNALVVGFVMGFAVIPIIYTISEDALSNVPQNMISGSLALGATRWQTALRVVLPTAAAGIFSAVMIGLGRAVGETMIVLMATGNTPIMDWNIFNGFRTLSANIAVEIPEAPLGGTLYRVLFLSAMLLFILTFVVNTLAELVRQRLREKYQKL